MDGREAVSKSFRKDMRKLKLMEYLASKGKQKPSNSKPCFCEEDIPVKKPDITEQRAVADNVKENQTPNIQLKTRKAVKVIPPQRPAVLPGRLHHQTVEQRDGRPTCLAELGQQPLATRTYSIASIRAKAASDSQSIMQSAADAIQQANRSSSTRTSRANVNPASSIANPPSSRANGYPTRRASSVATTNPPSSKANGYPTSRPSSIATANPPSSRANANPSSNFRISLGPLVKTKTGLVPAVVQFRIPLAAAASGPLTATTTPRTTTRGPRLPTAVSTVASRARPITVPSKASTTRPITVRSTSSRARPITAPSTTSRARQITAPSTTSRTRPITIPSTACRARPITAPSTTSSARPITVPSTSSRARPITAPPTGSRARPITASSTASRTQQNTAPSTGSRARPITASSTASRTQQNTTTTTSVSNPSRLTTTSVMNQAHPTTTTVVNQAHPTTTTVVNQAHPTTTTVVNQAHPTTTTVVNQAHPTTSTVVNQAHPTTSTVVNQAHPNTTISSVARTSRLLTTSTSALGPVHMRSATARRTAAAPPPPPPVPPPPVPLSVQRRRALTAATGNRKSAAPPRDQERLSRTSRVSVKAAEPNASALQPRPGRRRTWTCIPAAPQNQRPNLALTRAMHQAVEQFVTEGEPATKSNAPCVAEAFSVPPTSSRCHRTGRVQSEAPPLTEQGGPTAAQQKQMKKLQEWREAKGISYKRPPMKVRPRLARCTVALPLPYWASIEHENQTQALVSTVEASLTHCIKLLDEGCPPQQVQDVLAGLPDVAQRFCKYWICRVRLSELEGQVHVLPLFEEAVRLVLQPVDELRTVVFDIMKKTDVEEALRTDPVEEEEEVGELSPERRPSEESVATPKPLRAFIQGEQDSSSVVKYKITSTPGGFRSQQREPARVNGQELRFFTPVRRSVRIEQASLHYPASLQEHDLCVTSYDDLLTREADEEGGASRLYVYRENKELREQVHIQLYDDEEEEEEEEEEEGAGEED